jgi:hypothetical protein
VYGSRAHDRLNLVPTRSEDSMTHDGPTTVVDPAAHVLRIASGYILSAALNVAIELGLADRLANGPRTATDLAEESGTQPEALYRLLRALASAGIFVELSAREFGLTPAAAVLQADAPGSMRSFARMFCDPTHLRLYSRTMASVRTGTPAVESAFGVPVFEFFAQNREYSERFNDAMTSLSAMVIPAVLQAYDFSEIQVLVDVAGGHGELLMSVLRHYPAMRGILTDVGHVIDGARPRIQKAGLSDRCEALGMDFFQSAPAGADAYLLKGVIHDWDDARAALILRNIHAAMGDTRGKVIVIDPLIPSGNAPHFGKILDLEMLLWAGGRERTAEEFRTLFDQAGFELTRIVGTRSPVAVIEGQKKL